MKIKNRSRKRDGIGVRRIITFPFLPTPFRTPSLTFRLWSSENYVIGLVIPLLLPTPTIRFSLNHKRNVSDGVVSGVGTLLSLDHKLYACDYDSGSVVCANHP